MRFVFYTHSLVSDWNHGNAHFLRGVMRELVARGHEATALEPENGWSRTNLTTDQGSGAEAAFHRIFPELVSRSYSPDFDHAAALDGADVVVVHEWTDPDLVRQIGELRRRERFTLLFHDTHHRAVSSEEVAGLALDDYDGVLAFGEALRGRYLARGWGRRVFTWHEAADTSLFRPRPEIPRERDLIWVGNWGDGERADELDRFLVEPVRRLGISADVRGVRYPAEARERLDAAGIDYGGWIANTDVPAEFARHRVTVHVPRRPYVSALPGIPTIRPFEALACGIPLVSSPWEDAEGLFRPGTDFLFAHDTEEMAATIKLLLNEPDRAQALAEHGLETIRARHTCAHRVDELLGILDEVAPVAREAAE